MTTPLPPATRAEARDREGTVITRNAKAYAAGAATFIVAFLSALLPYLDAGVAHVTAYGLVTAIIAGIVSTGLVAGVTWHVPNTSSAGE